MIDVSKLRYRVYVVSDSGKRTEITDYIENVGWEENEDEISMRSSFTARNDKISKKYISQMAKPGCLIIISASVGKTEKEVARGYVTTWNPVLQNDSNTLKCTNYDELYYLQKSQDNRYFAKGTGTKSAIIKILNDWKVPIGKYDGPDVKHGKKKYNNEYISDMILDFLDDAKKKGNKKYMIRASGGKTSILPYGSNSTIYVFDKNNTKVVSHSQSTAELVTRVRVIGKEEVKKKKSDKSSKAESKQEDEKYKVYATLNGLTKYGIRQRIYTRGSDETLKAAKKAAHEILDEKGDIEKSITLQAPDVPFVRKGDIVYVKVKVTEGYYYVTTIRHDADEYSMTMELELAYKSKISKNSRSEKSSYKVGDIVNFKGGKHYVSSRKGAKGYDAKTGKAKITRIIPNGQHPYHLIHTDGKSNVYGWVDSGSFS